MPGAAASRHPARCEAICLLVAAALTAAVFAQGRLDVAVARAFYDPDPLAHWPLAHKLPWSLLYQAAPWLTAVLASAGLAMLAAGLLRARPHWGRAGAAVLLALAIGPGLLANALFKDHWQRPRPRDLVQFGGSLQYVSAPLIGAEGGASFPCGHCSVGFMYGAGWWIWRQRRRAWAVASLAAGLALGLLLGIGRMAAGAHFLSDVVWSALLAFGVLHVLCHYVLPMPDTSLAAAGPQRARAAAVLALLAAAGVLLALFVTPHGTALSARVALTRTSPRTLEVSADSASVTVLLLDTPDDTLEIDGELHGFGLPGSRLAAHLDSLREPRAALRYRIESSGWLTDVDGIATLRVPAARFDALSVALRRGNIRVEDLTRLRVVASGRLHLELHTAHGHIQRAD